MYMFSMMSIPLMFVALVFWTNRSAEPVWRAAGLGLFMGIPAILLWMLIAPLYAPLYGSPLLVLSFFIRCWLVPFGLSILAYSLTIGLPGLARKNDYDRFLGFMAGSMTLFALANTVYTWGQPSRVLALLLPLVMASSVLAFPVFVEEAVKDGMPAAIKQIVFVVAGFTVAATGISLFFFRLEWLGFVLSVLYLAGTIFLGLRRLFQKH